MRIGCIDIGSNLVADSEGRRLLCIHQERAFTRSGHELQNATTIGAAKIAELVAAIGRASGLAVRILSAREEARPPVAVAVVGSATSLRRLAGAVLDPEALGRALALLVRTRSSEIADRFSIDPQRARRLPPGLLILEAAAERFGTALRVEEGGIRERMMLEAATS